MKSQRKQPHNTVLTESGVSIFLCINSQKEIVSITIDQKGPALFLSSNFIFIQTSTSQNLNCFRSFFGYKKEIYAFQFFVSVFLSATKMLSFLFSPSSKNITSRYLSLFGTRRLPLRLLCASDALLHQLGYQPARICLIIFLKSVIILH